MSEDTSRPTESEIKEFTETLEAHPEGGIATKSMISVMQEVRELHKEQRNREQNYRFRGIDDLMNLLGPVLRTYELIISVDIAHITHDSYETSSGKRMNRAIVHTTYSFTAPDDSVWVTHGVGEGADFGDKSTSKALSMAMKYALIQALCLPTDDTDPDAVNPADEDIPEAHSRRISQRVTEDEGEDTSDPLAEVKQKILDWAEEHSVSIKELQNEFKANHNVTIPEGTLEQLQTFYARKLLQVKEDSTE